MERHHQIARFPTLDLTAGSGCARLVLALDAEYDSAMRELRALVAFVAASDPDDGSAVLHAPGDDIPSDDEFEAVDAVHIADAIAAVRDWFDLDEFQVAPLVIQQQAEEV